MGAGELEVDPEKMRNAAGGIHSTSQTLQTNFNNFQQEMAGQSDAFGDDDLGSIIGGLYQAIHEVAFGSYNDNTGEMKSRVQSVHDLTDAYSEGEQASTSEVNNVRNVLG